MFPIAFPLRALAYARRGDAVLDPFCGRGTTGYAARLLGLPNAGVDADAVAVAIARAKLASRSPEQVESRCAQLLEAVPESSDIPDGEFWSLAFAPETLRQICRLRDALLGADTDDDVLLRALVLGILHGPQSVEAPSYLSNQMPRTYATKPKPAVAYWRKHDLTPRHVDVQAAVSRRARHVLSSMPDRVRGSVIQGDSRQIRTLGLTTTFSHVVTSPPYLGMRTYRPDQWLRHWFLGGPPDVAYSVEDMLPPNLAAFSDELRKVWNGVASVCRPGAELTVRFGALPSVKANAETALRSSLEGTPWKIESVVSAGSSTLGKRQAAHMNCKGAPVDEIDLRALMVA